MNAVAFDVAADAGPAPIPLPERLAVPGLAPELADRFDIVTTSAGFAALEGEWTALFARAASGTQAFQGFEWLAHWAAVYLDSSSSRTSLSIVTVRRDGRLVLVWPLVVERVAGIRQLAWMGDPVSQYGDILADDIPGRAAMIRASWAFITQTIPADAVRLAKVRADAAAAPLMADLGARIVASEEAPWCDLAKAGTFEKFQSRFNAKAQKNRRRHARRLEERGTLAFERHTCGEAAADAVAACIVLKRAWLNSKGLVSRAFADERIEAFFKRTLASQHRPAGVAVSLLRSAGEIADASIVVDAKGRRAVHIVAYGLKFEKSGPGGVHLEHAVRQAFSDGVSVLDFMAPRHDYKMEWADGVVRVDDFAVPLTVRGRLYVGCYLVGVREGLKAVIAAMPPGARRRLSAAHRRLHAIVGR